MIRNAITQVVDSYTDGDSRNQVLIQPQLNNVAKCGVLFTRDIQNGGPYYVVNYDESGATDKITSGVSEDQQTHYINKTNNHVPDDSDLRRLVLCAKELEELTGNQALDIEFAFDKGNELYVFQVRPLVLRESIDTNRDDDIRCIIQETRDAINRCNRRRGGVAGRRTLLSDMSDWNPAELIGSHPRPLARSLFEKLISDDVWRTARAEVGYANPESERLMVTLAGHPYIDTRNSFNSFLPASIGANTSERVINEELDFLESNPHLHDKVEFAVTTNCFTPLFDRMTDRYRASGMSDEQIAELREKLLSHTESIIRGEQRTVRDCMAEVETLDEDRMSILASKADGNVVECISKLVEDCKQRGTKQFSTIARMAFIGNALVRSFIEEGAISQNRHDAFLNSFETVAGEMDTALRDVRIGKLSREEFLEQFGHLRPGTFDVLSPRYDEAADVYFSEVASSRSEPSSQKKKAHVWRQDETAQMQKVLRNAGMSLDIDQVLHFAQEAIVGREKAKFLFTKNVSEILKLVREWGQLQGLSEEELSYLEIDEILSGNSPETLRLQLKQSETRYHTEEQIVMPELIANVMDVEHIRFIDSRPNFITQERCSGTPLILTGKPESVSLGERIIFIESADPGFDWIFAHNIRGLVTKYGGAASHMAIRCAEFGLPAAIGTGRRFDQLKTAPVVEIDCANHSIRAVQ